MFSLLKSLAKTDRGRALSASATSPERAQFNADRFGKTIMSASQRVKRSRREMRRFLG
jgi:hypothetical protein